MISKKLTLLLMLGFAILTRLAAQQIPHPRSQEYEWPEDKAVLKTLEKWRDQKFGIIIHWGLYAVPGIIESWGLCAEDWIRRPDSLSYCEYKAWYWGLKDEFNPQQFNPGKWAAAAKDAGMRYLIFTTKHHDGFNMFDTKQSDFKITNGPFANHPKANVAKFVFEAFRNKGFMIGAYYSKPDWHSQYFWWDKYATPNRNVNYDIRKHPARWEKFKAFTYSQIGELMRGYGKIDILWLDGGWIRPLSTVNEEVLSWGAPIPEWEQRIDMPKIAAMARSKQSGLLIVDRTVHGKFENYQTPERNIPEEQLEYPWESCIPLGNNWGYVQNDEFKSSTQVIHSLIEIVAKGGSLLLGIGPKPDGTLADPVLERLKAIGDWMDKNGKAIYNTRVTENYRSGETFFTKGKEGTLYALTRIPEGEKTPSTLYWTGNVPARDSKMILLSNGSEVKWSRKGEKVTVEIPRSFIKKEKKYPAITLSFIPE